MCVCVYFNRFSLIQKKFPVVANAVLKNNFKLQKPVCMSLVWSQVSRVQHLIIPFLTVVGKDFRIKRANLFCSEIMRWFA